MDHLIDDNDRLKPCPFCGGEATFDHDDNGWNWVECLACGASTNARVSAMDDCKPPLLEQWNKRVPPACGCREGECESKPAGFSGAQSAPIEMSITTGALSEMFLSLGGHDKTQPGYEWRKGWNDAIRQAMDYAQPAPSVPDGWKEDIAWEVCASIPREYGKGKDPFFSTRQGDFVKHANDARAMLAGAPEAKP